MHFEGFFSPIVDAIEAKLQLPEVTLLRGGRALYENGSPPRIVWALGGENIWGPTEKLGGNVRCLYARPETLWAFIWGENYKQAEEILNDVGAAIHESHHGRVQNLRHRWLLPSEAAWANRGEVVVLRFDVRIPVSHIPYDLAKVTSIDFDATGAAAGDGVLQAAGEP